MLLSSCAGCGWVCGLFLFLVEKDGNGATGGNQQCEAIK